MGFICGICFLHKSDSKFKEVKIGSLEGYVCIDCYNSPTFKELETRILKEEGEKNEKRNIK